MNDISIISYNDIYRDKWDKFVLEGSANGTLLQTRVFLEYHPASRFIDNSLLFMNKNNIIAVLPANIVDDNSLVSHQGSTFGGLIIGKQYCKINNVESIIETFDDYLKEKSIKKVILKQTSSIFQVEKNNLIDYFLFTKGFNALYELGYYIDFKDYTEDIISSFSSSRRRDYRYSLKKDLVFKELKLEKEIKWFYEILCDNYRKFNKNPIHSFEELIDLKNNRIKEHLFFYGVFLEEKMISGSMVFSFANNVFHTQYIAVAQEYNNIFVSEFLYKNLIETAKNNQYKYLSFGTCTLEGGKILNKNLALFKEGFGTKPYINITYEKTL